MLTFTRHIDDSVGCIICDIGDIAGCQIMKLLALLRVTLLVVLWVTLFGCVNGDTVGFAIGNIVWLCIW